MTAKKILFVTTVPQMLKAFLLPFADHFRRCGFQVDAMSSAIASLPELTEHFDHLWEVDFSRSPFRIKNFLAIPRQIISIVKNNHYDLVHVHSPVAAFVCRYALQSIPKQHRPKVVYTVHGFHFYQGGNFLTNTAFFLLEKIAGRWTDRLITMNVDDYVVARKKRIIPRSQLVYMPGIGLDTNYYSKQTIAPERVQQWRDSLGIKADEHIFLMIAEFTRQKRQQLVVEAFAELAPNNAHLVLVGLGKYFAKVNNWVIKNNLTHRVHLLGFQTEIPMMIHSALVTILASNREGLPRAVLESLSLETAVIGSDTRGIKDLLHKEFGILVPRGNQKRLVLAMHYMLQNPQKAATMAQGARGKLKKYNQENIILRHEVLYNQLIG